MVTDATVTATLPLLAKMGIFNTSVHDTRDFGIGAGWSSTSFVLMAMIFRLAYNVLRQFREQPKLV